MISKKFLVSAFATAVVLAPVFPNQAMAKAVSKDVLEQKCTDMGGIYYESDDEYGCWLPDQKEVFCIDWANECVVIDSPKMGSQGTNQSSTLSALKKAFGSSKVVDNAYHQASYPEYKHPGKKKFTRKMQLLYKSSVIRLKRGSGVIAPLGKKPTIIAPSNIVGQNG